MADFRKCLIAFALVALLSVAASAQVTPALQCLSSNAVTPTVRSEGVAELLGDIVLDCTGGTPTLAGNLVPQANITVFLSTNMTSRITSNPFTEVLLLVDEPHSPSNLAVPLSECTGTLGICSISGSPSSNGVGTYDGSTGRPNIFQARVTGQYQVTFFGVPIDPPGTSGHRVFRITNLRGNASLIGVTTAVLPTNIVANVSVSPPNLLPLNNPQQTVAYIAKGIADGYPSVVSAYTFIQCMSANKDNAGGDASKALGTGTQDGQQFTIRFQEGFPSAWKEKNIAQHLANTTSTYAYPADLRQDVPGSAYFSESGFLVGATGVLAAPSAVPVGFGPVVTINGSLGANVYGSEKAGLANQGTRLMVQFASVPSGVRLFVPTLRNLVVPANSNALSGVAVLVTTDASGAGAYSPVNSTPGLTTLAEVTVSGGAGTAVYEVLLDDPFNIERLNIPIAVSYAANAGNNLPTPNLQSTATGGFAPLSSIETYDTGNTAPIPRFKPSTTPVNSFKIVKCSCNLLFPWVVYTQGYDTGVAISNTSVDPFGTTPQQGNVTINYYSAGTPPPAKKTTAPVPAGQSLVFTVSGGGNFGIDGISSGFAGYIIAQAEFQYCHGYAYISSFGALPTSPGTSEGYLGIVMDEGGLFRTGQIGENLAH